MRQVAAIQLSLQPKMVWSRLDLLDPTFSLATGTLWLYGQSHNSDDVWAFNPNLGSTGQWSVASHLFFR